jgi:hypothetical protein
MVDEIEAAGCVPKLVHARKAKLMMGEINKTDRLDVRGLNRLQRNGTLTAWILSKQEPYREPKISTVSSTGDKREISLSSWKLDR